MGIGENASAGPAAEEVLRDRARALARPPQDSSAARSTIEVLEFRLAQERYAVETRHVVEVIPLKDLTPLPCVPRFVLGVVNVRGRILSVVDMKKFFDLPEAGLNDLHRVIIVRGDGLEFGLLADTTVGISDLEVESLQPALATLTDIRAEYLKGVTKERLVVLDLSRMLADPKLLVHDEADD